jgi:hypothetical protein
MEEPTKTPIGFEIQPKQQPPCSLFPSMGGHDALAQ